MIGPAEIFTLLFVTLGPLKLLGPFAQRTRDVDESGLRTIAVRASVIATVVVIAGGFIGGVLLAKWHIAVSSLTLAAGIIFFLVALRQLLEQYEPAPVATPVQLPASPTAAALKLIFPIVLTPYGIAVVIALLATSETPQDTAIILSLLLLVMALNLAGMLFARRILSGPSMIVLQLLGAVLGVMQIALSIQFIVAGLRALGLITVNIAP